MELKKTDGGRAAAGYQGETGDCVVRAIAVALEKPYQEVYDALAALMSQERLKRKRGSPRNGVPRSTYERYLKSNGWEFVPTMAIGSGCKVHLKAEELPKGRIICRVSKHLVAVIDGVMHDSHDPSRGGTRCVYGYYRKRETVIKRSETWRAHCAGCGAILADWPNGAMVEAAGRLHLQANPSHGSVTIGHAQEVGS